jgi:ribosome-associated heat shock protein Hsp15
VRLDAWLKAARLCKQRSQARAACEGGRVTIGGSAAKPAREVRLGDEIEVRLPRRRLRVAVLGLPDGPVSRKDAATLYRVLGEERLVDDELWGE